MGWADPHIARLRAGETVRFRPVGNSMAPLVRDGDLCTVAPVAGPVEPGAVVLCSVGQAQYLHLVKAIRRGRYQIGNNHGRINGWVGPDAIHGRRVGRER